jgi:hypothetical protein
VAVEVERARQALAPHAREADAVDEAQFSPRGSQLGGRAFGVKVGVDPHDSQHRHDIVLEAPHCSEPETVLQQRRCLDQDVVCGEQGFLRFQERAQGARSARVIVVGCVEGCQQRRPVDEDAQR